ncbi:hypothetical protein ABZW32_16970 [Streptomyces sp. NPDC004667]|uniref:hypothetical protein n=1 Tax=Streptomyces sp. NPDC004667 TaxID=3154285 RepID=UPI0033BF4532
MHSPSTSPTPTRQAAEAVTALRALTASGRSADAVEVAREVLGDPGRARARALVVAAWRANPKGWAERYLMERLLKADGGGVDAEVKVHAADLAPDGRTHLVIARELETAGRPGEALEWAELGLRETVSDQGPDGDLVAFVCERYARADRPADVVAVRRDLMRARPSLAAYQDLRTAARATGTWEGSEREDALESLKAVSRPTTDRWCGGSPLVDALIDDNDLQPAWQAAADGYADQRQWLVLADRLRDRRPADALTVYLRCIEPLREQSGDRAYERLAELLLSARACHRTLGTEAEFATYLATLRADQKRKRKLMAVLEQHGL